MCYESWSDANTRGLFKVWAQCILCMIYSNRTIIVYTLILAAICMYLVEIHIPYNSLLIGWKEEHFLHQTFLLNMTILCPVASTCSRLHGTIQSAMCINTYWVSEHVLNYWIMYSHSTIKLCTVLSTLLSDGNLSIVQAKSDILQTPYVLEHWFC